MAFFTLVGVLRRFPAAAYEKYASPETFVRPCPAKKILIYELDIHSELKAESKGSCRPVFDL